MSDKEKFRLVILCTAAFAVILTFSVILSLIKTDGSKSGAASLSPNADNRIPIPTEEIFFPEEPNFVPGVMLEREQRPAWTTEDAALYWQDPLKDGEEHWRKNIEDSVDEFLERIP